MRLSDLPAVCISFCLASCVCACHMHICTTSMQSPCRQGSTLGAITCSSLAHLPFSCSCSCSPCCSCCCVAASDRVFGILRERNPELTGERRRTVLKPPQVSMWPCVLAHSARLSKSTCAVMGVAVTCTPCVQQSVGQIRSFAFLNPAISGVLSSGQLGVADAPVAATALSVVNVGLIAAVGCS